MKMFNSAAGVFLIGIGTLGASCAARQPTQPSLQPAPADAITPGAPAPASDIADVSTNDLLDRMHTLGQTLTSLRANVEMKTQDDVTGNGSSRVGTFLLQKRGEADSRARVNLEKLIIDNDDGTKKIIPERIEYVLEGDWVVDRVYGRGPNDPGGRRETHRQIRKPGEKVDLLKLGEGPFPLPIGQPRDSVRAQFEVTRLPDDPAKPGLIGLELRPREETRLARRFHQIVIWIDQNDAMPRVIETISADIITKPDPSDASKQTVELVAGTESKQTMLTEVKINQPVNDEDFKLEPIDEAKWDIVREEYHE